MLTGRNTGEQECCEVALAESEAWIETNVKAIETKKFIAWLMALFPNWKPDSVTTMAWGSELPDVSSDVAMQAVRVFADANGGAFPPSIFQIKKAILGDGGSPRQKAVTAFAEIWQFVGGSEGKKARDLDPIAQEALRLIGGTHVVGRWEIDKRGWLENRFSEIYENLLYKSGFSSTQKQIENFPLKMIEGKNDRRL